MNVGSAWCGRRSLGDFPVSLSPWPLQRVLQAGVSRLGRLRQWTERLRQRYRPAASAVLVAVRERRSSKNLVNLSGRRHMLCAGVELLVAWLFVAEHDEVHDRQ